MLAYLFLLPLFLLPAFALATADNTVNKFAASHAPTNTVDRVAAPHAPDPTRVPISTTSFGAWEGWGTSLAWWANVWGTSAALADVAFSCHDAIAVPGIAQPLPGLCMNIARYNLGGSSNASAGGQRIVYSPNIPWCVKFFPPT